MFLTQRVYIITKKGWISPVAIPSNRVNVSYEVIKAKLVSPETSEVAIPSNRVNVSYGKVEGKHGRWNCV